jgi:hypothetical protein
MDIDAFFTLCREEILEEIGTAARDRLARGLGDRRGYDRPTHGIDTGGLEGNGKCSGTIRGQAGRSRLQDE